MIPLYPFHAKNYEFRVSSNYQLLASELHLDFFVEDVQNRIDDFYPLAPGERKSLIFKNENLWSTTCFEIFLKNLNSKDYYEFNFNSKSDWNLFYFSSYRERVTGHLPNIEVVSENQPDSATKHLRFRFNIGKLEKLKLPCQISLASVIKSNSEISYWSQKHNSIKPDFHDASNFTLVLNSDESRKIHG